MHILSGNLPVVSDAMSRTQHRGEQCPFRLLPWGAVVELAGEVYRLVVPASSRRGGLRTFSREYHDSCIIWMSGVQYIGVIYDSASYYDV